MVGDKRQGYAIVAVMALLFLASIVSINVFQGIHHGTVPTSIGASMEGVEQRFGVPDSATFAGSTTLTSTGAVDSFHDSYTSLGGMVTLLDMQLHERADIGQQGRGRTRHHVPDTYAVAVLQLARPLPRHGTRGEPRAEAGEPEP